MYGYAYKLHILARGRIFGGDDQDSPGTNPVTARAHRMNHRDAAPMTLAELPDALVLWSPTTGEVTVGEIRSERVRLITT